LDLPTVLRVANGTLLLFVGIMYSGHFSDTNHLPSSHVLFSHFDFGRDGRDGAELGEDSEDLDDEFPNPSGTKHPEKELDDLGGGWLEDDTIEDM
jgi:hypothetical protein